jgi:CheY-like chemotaxis protein
MTHSYTVLIVDDDEWLAKQYERTLIQAGFHTFFAPHALAAIELLDDKKPDAIVLDLFLAGPNALTLLHEIRSHIDLASIPVILCTNSTDVVIAEDVASYGVELVLDKTIMQPQDLVAAVKKVLL